MGTILIKAGERKRVIHRFSNSMQEIYNFSAVPINPTENLSGIVEVSGSNWIFPKPLTKQKLMNKNCVSKGMWDVLYRVYVVPDVDINITLSKTERPNLKFLFLFAGVITLVALAVVAFTMLK